MLTATGCLQRRTRLLERIRSQFSDQILCLADPIHLMYLANFSVDPFSLGGGFGGILLIHPDGRTQLFHDDRLPDSAEGAHVDERIVVPWYDAQTPGAGPRQLAPLRALRKAGIQLPIHDQPGQPTAELLIETLAQLRRQKDADEIDLLKKCMRAGEKGHAWALQHVRPGMTELEVYGGINSACIKEAGQAVIVYGDFAVSPGSDRRGGPPTSQVIQPGDMLILDFSVVIAGYRGDFTNTMVVGAKPRPEQQRLVDLCKEAMAAGEKKLKSSQPCQVVYDAVHEVFDRAGLAEYFPHHAGHGLGLTHPEAPYIVRHSTDTLLEGDVITLEPGLYINGIGGIRIENNYRITPDSFERLNHHSIRLS